MNSRFIALIGIYLIGVPVISVLLLLLAPLDRVLFGDMHFLCVRAFLVCTADSTIHKHLYDVHH